MGNYEGYCYDNNYLEFYYYSLIIVYKLALYEHFAHPSLLILFGNFYNHKKHPEWMNMITYGTTKELRALQLFQNFIKVVSSAFSLNVNSYSWSDVPDMNDATSIHQFIIIKRTSILRIHLIGRCLGIMINTLRLLKELQISAIRHGPPSS